MHNLMDRDHAKGAKVNIQTTAKSGKLASSAKKSSRKYSNKKADKFKRTGGK